MAEEIGGSRGKMENRKQKRDDRGERRMKQIWQRSEKEKQKIDGRGV